jgi:hypothetical protein
MAVEGEDDDEELQWTTEQGETTNEDGETSAWCNEAKEVKEVRRRPVHLLFWDALGIRASFYFVHS